MDPLANQSSEALIGAILTLRVEAQSYMGYKEPGHSYLQMLAIGYYSLDELRRRLSTDDWNWWLELFRFVGAVKQEAKNA